ncbi:hypothetical protein PWT90_02438 [Aphanocladium album]|nr:hypothetical protein PWT90_02438 [Aphanocladium album]
MKISSFIAGGFAARAFASPLSYQIHGQRSTVGSHIKGRAVARSASISASIALKQNNVEKAEAILLDISDPDSPRYGQHLTSEEIVNLFAPEEKKIDHVKKWLVSSGVPGDSVQVSGSRGWIQFNTTAGQLGDMLQAEYHHYTARDSSEIEVGTDAYSLPEDISSLVEFVHPATSLAGLHRRDKSTKFKAFTSSNDTIDPDSLTTCDLHLTPKCIAAMYGIPKGRLAQPGNELGIYEEVDNMYAQEDLDQLFAAMNTGIPKGTGPVIHNINGGHAPAAPGKADYESSLDFELAIPIVYPQKTRLFQMGDEVPGDTFDEFLALFTGRDCQDSNTSSAAAADNAAPCKKLRQPNVLSVSWGTIESPEPDQVAKNKRQCTEWMKFALAGTSVFSGSGDRGVEVIRCWGPDQDMFSNDQLSACPYVTAVGSTYLPQGAKVGDAEVATTSFSSGGGFSIVYPRPAWQDEAVSTYIENYVPNYKSFNTTDGKIPTISGQGIYNRGGRAYPDISAAGDNGVIVQNGKTVVGQGTSMSAPIVAAMFNLVNEERIHIGKRPLGFINPALYKAQAKGIFADVVVGDQSHDSKACGTNKGFVASKGWDPVTGLGTPKYEKILKYFKNL